MLSESLIIVLAIDASNNAGTDIERVTCHVHDLGHLLLLWCRDSNRILFSAEEIKKMPRRYT